MVLALTDREDDAEGTESGPEGASSEALEELVRQGERQIDAQIRAHRNHESKSERLLITTVTLMAGGPALGGLALQVQSHGGGIGKPEILSFLVLLCGALICAGIAFHYVMKAYLGTRGNPITLDEGWDPDVLREVSHEDRTAREVHLGTLTGIPNWFEYNKKTFRRIGPHRRTGLNWLVGSAFLFAVSFLGLLAFGLV